MRARTEIAQLLRPAVEEDGEAMLSPEELKPLVTLAHTAAAKMRIKISDCCVVLIAGKPPHVLPRAILRLPKSVAPTFARERIAASVDGALNATKVLLLDEAKDSVHVINVDIELNELLEPSPSAPAPKNASV